MRSEVNSRNHSYRTLVPDAQDFSPVNTKLSPPVMAVAAISDVSGRVPLAVRLRYRLS
ncbi:MAG: hypothetical protein WD994_05270 [Pseudomonadales bacterium]